MAENKSKKNGGGEKKNTGAIVLKKDGNLTAVLKSDFHWDGCVNKVKVIRRERVEVYKEKLILREKIIEQKIHKHGEQKIHKHVEQKIHVEHKIHKHVEHKIHVEQKIHKHVEHKIHKRVELISPVQKKDGKGRGDAGAREGKKKQEKEPPITTAVLKVPLHCQGCIQDVQKIVTNFKEYKEMNIDKQKGLATVTGSMNNMKELAAKLKKHLNKEAEIVPLKKEGGDKKEKGRER